MRVNVYNGPDPWYIPSIKIHRFALAIEYYDKLILKNDSESVIYMREKHCIEKKRANYFRRIQSTSVHKKEMPVNELADAMSNNKLMKYLRRDVDSLLSGEDLATV
jgi:hypothetical protein